MISSTKCPRTFSINSITIDDFMDWFLLALTAPILWALKNIADKIIYSKYRMSAMTSLIMTRLMSIPFIIIFLFFIKVGIDEFALIGILYGVIHTAGAQLFNKAMVKEDVSKVTSLFYTNPIFTALFATIFLGEILTAGKYAGIVLLVLSAVMLSYRNHAGKTMLSSSLLLIFSSTIIWSALNVFLKWITNFSSVYSFVFWTFIGSIITALLLLLAGIPKKEFKENIKRFDGFAWKVEIAGNIVYWIGTAIFFIAISALQVSLIGAIPSLQPFFVLIFVLLMGVFLPKILKEENSKKSVLLKFLAVILIFIGTYLIAA